MSEQISALECSSQIAQLGHDLRGALNVIGLAAANVQMRAIAGLDSEGQAYLAAKMERIGQQVERACRLLDALGETVQSCDGKAAPGLCGAVTAP